MSGMPSSPRAKEYSELFDFFESLMKRRPRVEDKDATPESETVEVETPPVPPELVPLFHRKVSGNKRAVFADVSDSDDEDSDDGSSKDKVSGKDKKSGKAFPMPRNISPYPFSFKMMIHKIYEDEFLSKCNEFLAKSREQFKPLAEQPTPERSSPTSRLQAPILGGGKHNLPPTRPRRNTLATNRTNPPPASPRSPIPPPPRFPASTMRPLLEASRDDERATKKRCTGRRLSAVEPVPGWVYHSEIASAARDSRESFDAPPGSAAKEGPATRYKGLGLGHPSTNVTGSTPSKKRVRTRAVSMAGPTAQRLMV
ncbi:hypothetical protein K525DRAFT_269480 [Schizophyllum commune Loenen D]|nr:hypothetical protein K525DRAFT_269480 [Schizophyllum commune Loenen D]